MSDLTGRIVAITGAARGIGLATAKHLLREGCKVGVSDVDEIALKEVADELGPNAITVQADVTDPDSLRSFVDQVEEAFGPIDVMVNNAGIMPTGHLMEESEGLARRTVEINVLGVITGTKRALETMVPRGRGTIITLASMAGESAMPGLATYNASKWGALGFTLATRAEFMERGIDVCAVLPAFVNTELTKGLSGLAGIGNVEPEDVAEAIVATIRSPRGKVYVPRHAGALVQVTSLLPERVQLAVGKLLKATDVMLEAADPAKRAEYLERIGR